MNKVVQPLMCPSCGKHVYGIYRYGNVNKQKKEMIEMSCSFVRESTTLGQRDGVIEKIFLNSLSDEHKVKPLEPQKTFKYLPKVFKMLVDTLRDAIPMPLVTLNIAEYEVNQYISLKKCLPLCEQYSDLLDCLQELIAFFEETCPSVQKCHDVTCEKQRILLLWMISSLKSTISVSHDDYCFLRQLDRKLKINQPKMTLSVAANYYDELLKLAQRVESSTEVDSEHFQPIKAVFVSGVWTICPQKHVYCEPRGVCMAEKKMWLCPQCFGNTFSM